MINPVSLPILTLSASAPNRLNVNTPPSASVAVTVPIAVWFSSAVKDESDVIAGALSLRLLMATVISWVTSVLPSVTVTVAL